MNKAEKRVLIAKDVIAQLISKQYTARVGYYVQFKNPVVDYIASTGA